MEFPISNIFQWLTDNSIFCIKRKELITFLNCGFNSINEYFLNPLISIYIKDINSKNLCEILDRLKAPSCGSCETCIYVGDEIKKIFFMKHVNKKLFKIFYYLIFYFLYLICQMKKTKILSNMKIKFI